MAEEACVDLTSDIDEDDAEAAELQQLEAELQQIDHKIASLVARQQALQGRAETLRRVRETNRRCPRADWQGAFEWDAHLARVLRTTFGLQGFRPLQREVINCTMSGRHCLCLLPSGGGKSLCYQLPALAAPAPGSKGTPVTLVISPLLSLIQDQTLGLTALGIQGAALTSLTGKDEAAAIYKRLDDPKGDICLLYVTPEKVVNAKRFISKLEKLAKAGRLARIAIDEAHCCSQWGNDFRPDYRKLGFLSQQFPDTPILALTATATAKVCDDIRSILRIEGCDLFKGSIDRPNLFYEVDRVMEKPTAAAEVTGTIVSWIRATQPDRSSGIVYCLTCKETETLAAELSEAGLPAAPYHAQMDPAVRQDVHRRWAEGQTQIIVATVAFGMGINKVDVRYVVHQTLAKSLENYYQESGRSGRDGKPANCLLLFRFADVMRLAAVGNQEYDWEGNIMSMAAYATSAGMCRRALLCRHFGETPAACAGGCDVCAASPGTVTDRDRDANTKAVDIRVGRGDDGGGRPGADMQDVSREARSVLAALAALPATDKRATLIQLIDRWRALKPDAVDDAASGKGRPKEEAERIIGHMLLGRFLALDFGYTAYAVTAYLKAGPNAAALQQGRHSLSVQARQRKAARRARDPPDAGQQRPKKAHQKSPLDADAAAT